MTEHHARDDAVKTLSRMLAYVRDEAVRLSMSDVALLLRHAEGAVAAFAPGVRPDHGPCVPTHDGDRVEH